jgi:hypothetical protein
MNLGKRGENTRSRTITEKLLSLELFQRAQIDEILKFRDLAYGSLPTS